MLTGAEWPSNADPPTSSDMETVYPGQYRTACSLVQPLSWTTEVRSFSYRGLTSFCFCRMSGLEPFGFFEEPVTEELAPGYGKVVSQPMCFRVRAASLVLVSTLSSTVETVQQWSGSRCA